MRCSLLSVKEAGDFGPHRVRSSVTGTNGGVKYLLGAGEEEPTNHGGVDGPPLGVHAEEIDRSVDMVKKIVLAEEKTEVRFPRVEVGLGVGEFHRDALEDRNITDGCRSRTRKRQKGC